MRLQYCDYKNIFVNCASNKYTFLKVKTPLRSDIPKLDKKTPLHKATDTKQEKDVSVERVAEEVNLYKKLLQYLSFY